MIIYVETNWLVSCVLPHHPWRKDARALLDAANEGRCHLRIPAIAFLEARHVVEKETTNHAKAVTAVATSLQDAALNHDGRVDLSELAARLLEAEKSYHLTDPQRELKTFAEQCQAFSFFDAAAEQQAFDDLRAKVEMRGADITDLYVLAAVIADREQDTSRPAAFLSTNFQEFAVDRASAKLPRNVYALRKLVYFHHFNLSGAQNLWDKEDAKGWPPQAAPPFDKRRQEAQKILFGLDADKLDEALAALKILRAS